MSKIWYKIRLLFGRSEFTVLDGSSVSAIAEMQKKIDAYEDYILLLGKMVRTWDVKTQCILRDTPLNEVMSGIWVDVMSLIRNNKANDEKYTNKGKFKK